MNSVNSIKQVKEQFRFEARKEIKRLGPPRPELNIKQENIVKGKTAVRKFNLSMYMNADWLCGCNLTNSFYCFVCLLMGSYDSDPAWSQTGIRDLKHLREKVKKHALSQKHLNLCLEFATLGCVDIRNQLSSDHRLEVLKHNETVRENRKILEKLIDCIKFCSEFELSLLGNDENSGGVFKGLGNLLAKFDDILKIHIGNSNNSVFIGLSKTIQNELLDSIYAVCQNLIKKEIEETNFIAIQADETTDNANITQLVFIVRYVKQWQIFERFITFVQPSGQSADEISSAILEQLEKININQTPDKLISQSYDGAAVMSDEKNGVQAKIKSIYKKGNFVHCYAHQLNLILERAASQNKQVKVFFANIDGFAAFFYRFPKKIETLDAIVKKRLPLGSKTRLDFSSKIVNTVFEYKKELVDYFQTIIDDENDKMAIRSATALMSYLRNDDFNFWLIFFRQILPNTDILYDQLQQGLLDSVKVVQHISKFTKRIQNIRDTLDDSFGNTSDGASLPKRPCYVDSRVEMAKEVCDAITTDIASRFLFTDYLEASLLFENDLFQQFCTSFPDQLFNVAVDTYNLDAISLKQELTTIYRREDFRNSSGVTHILHFLVQNDLSTVFPETVKLLRIICTIPMVSVESDRCFPTLKRVKTFVRSTGNQDRLCVLAMCSIENDLIRTTQNFNQLVIDHFVSQKDARMDFVYKRL